MGLTRDLYWLLLLPTSLTVVCPGVVERAHPAAVDGLVRVLILLPMLLETVKVLNLLDYDRNALLQSVQDVLVGVGITKKDYKID